MFNLMLWCSLNDLWSFISLAFHIIFWWQFYAVNVYVFNLTPIQFRFGNTRKFEWVNHPLNDESNENHTQQVCAKSKTKLKKNAVRFTAYAFARSSGAFCYRNRNVHVSFLLLLLRILFLLLEFRLFMAFVFDLKNYL